jgi:hypothetical protein
MDFPDDFPTHLQPPVERSIAQAEIEFWKRMDSSQSTGDNTIAGFVDEYILKVFFAFARQARRAGKDGVWTGERIRNALDDFLERLIRKAYVDLSRIGHPFESGYQDIRRKIRRSPDWMVHQKGMKDVARTQEWIASLPEVSTASVADERRRVVQPILDDKAWSTYQWALEANVNHHTAYDYLSGKRNPNRSTRLALAKALGIDVKALPS